MIFNLFCFKAWLSFLSPLLFVCYVHSSSLFTTQPRLPAHLPFSCHRKITPHPFSYMRYRKKKEFEEKSPLVLCTIRKCFYPKRWSQAKEIGRTGALSSQGMTYLGADRLFMRQKPCVAEWTETPSMPISLGDRHILVLIQRRHIRGQKENFYLYWDPTRGGLTLFRFMPGRRKSELVS